MATGDDVITFVKAMLFEARMESSIDELEEETMSKESESHQDDPSAVGFVNAEDQEQKRKVSSSMIGNLITTTWRSLLIGNTTET